MRRGWPTAAILLALFLATAAPASADCPDADLVPSAGAPTGPYATALLCLLNEQRAERGLRKLVSRPKLVEAATGHSQAMHNQGFFSHESQNGESFIDRIKATGYAKGASYWAVGENIGWGEGAVGTPNALVTSWMNSGPHRANILSHRFRQIGVGVAWGTPSGSDPHGVVITTDFGIVKH